MVDFFLVSQYFYYYKAPKHSLSALSHIRSASTPRIDRSASRYRTLSLVASNVAAAAAVAAQQDGHLPPSARYSQQSDQHRLYERSSSSRRFTEADLDYDDEEGIPPVMTDSFHSERGRETSGKRVSWSPERHRSRAASVGKSPTVPHILPINHLPDRSVESHERPSNEPSAPLASRRGSRASRRGSTMVFLGAWALFGIGTLASRRTGMAMSTNNEIGRVLVSVHTPIYYSAPDLPKLSINELDTFDSVYPRDDTPNEFPSNEQILGRVFAWLCTTLYLTSRLPQIWKNVSHNMSLKPLFF